MHPVVERAGITAELPSWARCEDARREHGKRVGDLMSEWASRLGRSENERIRWRATGVLHDALKDAPEPDLRDLAGEEWPPPVVHAPACAARLAADGVRDRSVLDAIRYHPVGHPDLDELGEYLILADYLEPGRDGKQGDRAGLRRQLPEARAAILTHVLRTRLVRLLEADRTLLRCSVDMWNRVVAR